MKKAYFSFIFSLLLFGANGIIAGHIALSSTDIVLYRTLIGSLLLLLIFVVSRKKWTFYKHRKDFSFLILSGVAMGASWMFLYESFAQIGVSVSTLLYSCGPIIVMLLSPLVFKEKLVPAKIIGFFIVFIGISLVNKTLIDDSANYIGIICGVLSAVTYSFMVIFNKKAKNISGLENSLLQLAIGFVTVATVVAFRGGFTFHIASSNIPLLLILGVINTGFGCYLYFSQLDKLPVQSVSVLSYLEPLSAVLLSVLLLNETLNILQIIGAVMVIGGAMFAELKKAPA